MKLRAPHPQQQDIPAEVTARVGALAGAAEKVLKAAETAHERAELARGIRAVKEDLKQIDQERTRQKIRRAPDGTLDKANLQTEINRKDEI